MKILVTGGTGRIGANLVVRLLTKGHSIRSFVYPADASRARKLDAYADVETVYGDLRNFDDVRQAVAGVDAIYHLAAAFQGPFNAREYLDINAMGTLNILESIRDNLPDLQRFVYASTEGVYWDARVNGRYFEEAHHRRHGRGQLSQHVLLDDQVAGRGTGHGLSLPVWRSHLRHALLHRHRTQRVPQRRRLAALFLYSSAYRTYSSSESYEIQDLTEPGDPSVREMIDTLLAGWDGQEKLLVSLNPNGVPYLQHFGDVRDIADGLGAGD